MSCIYSLTILYMYTLYLDHTHPNFPWTPLKMSPPFFMPFPFLLPTGMLAGLADLLCPCPIATVVMRWWVQQARMSRRECSQPTSSSSASHFLSSSSTLIWGLVLMFPGRAGVCVLRVWDVLFMHKQRAGMIETGWVSAPHRQEKNVESWCLKHFSALVVRAGTHFSTFAAWTWLRLGQRQHKKEFCN